MPHAYPFTYSLETLLTQGGRHYKVVNIRGVPTQTSFFYVLDPSVCNVDKDGAALGPDNDIPVLGVHLRYGMRTRAHLHYGPTDAGSATKQDAKQENQYCAVLQLGELHDRRLGPMLTNTTRYHDKQLNLDCFTPWAIVQGERPDADTPWTLFSANLVEGRQELSTRGNPLSISERLFLTKHWPRPEAPAADEEAYQGGEQTTKKYTFKVVDYQMCWEHMGKLHTGAHGRDADSTALQYTPLCNFEFYNYKAIYQFGDGTAPIHVLQLRWKNPQCDDGSVYCMALNAAAPSDLDGVQFVLVDVNFLFDYLKSMSDLLGVINRAWPRLHAMNLELTHFYNIINDMEAPDPITAITHFGKQKSGVYVAGNICYEKGLLLTHEQAKVAVIHNYFSGKNLHATHYPRIRVIPMPHVRYKIWTTLWNDIIKPFFGVNEMSAKAALCMGIMSLHADRFWAGEGGLAKFPIGLLHSDAAGTGKTIALSMVHALVGNDHVPLMTASSTPVAISTRLALAANNMLCLDDYVKAPGRFDSKWAELIRQVYEKNARAIGGDGACVRNIESPIMVTANETICGTDSAVQNRLIVLPFEKLSDSERLEELQTALPLLSACAQDWSSMLFEGKLDRAVISDCVTFLYQAVGVTTCRRTAQWGWLLYYMLMVSWVSQAPTDETEKIVRYIVEQAREATFVTQQENNMVTRFLVALSQVMPGGEMAGRPLSDKPSECVHWHNLRTNQTRGEDGIVDQAQNPFKEGETYYALRLQSVCNVIRVQLKKRFHYTELAKALLKWGAETGNAVLTQNCAFAKCESWPLYKLQGDVGEHLKIALEEDEIRGDLLSEPNNAAILINMKAFKDVVRTNRSGAGTNDDSFKDILIRPHNSPANGSALPAVNYPYNFWKMITNQEQHEPVNGDVIGSFIERAAFAMPYGVFCGAGNHINGDFEGYVEDQNAGMGFGSCADALSLDSLSSHFTYSYPKVRTLPPACTMMPYTARDDPAYNDTAIPDPLSFIPKVMYEDSEPYESEDYEESTEPGESDRWSPHASPRSHNSQSVGGFEDSPSKRQRTSEADYQSEQQNPPPAHPGHGSSTPLSDISNMKKQLHGGGLAGTRCGPIGVEAAMEEDAGVERELAWQLEIEREMQEEDAEFERELEWQLEIEREMQE